MYRTDPRLETSGAAYRPPGLNRPEIINVMPKLPAEIPGYGLPRLEEKRRRFDSQEAEDEAEDRRNTRALVAGVIISLALVAGDYINSRMENEQPAEPAPVVDYGYSYDPATGEYYYHSSGN